MWRRRFIRRQVVAARLEEAFTLLELLFVLVVLIVATCLALPRLTRMADRARAETAINNLRAIKTGEEVVRTRTDAYVTGLNDAAEINAALRLLIDDTAYDYDIIAGGPNFTARARLATNPGISIRINDQGVWSGTSPFVPNATE